MTDTTAGRPTDTPIPLEHVHLDSGSHTSPAGGCCLIECANLIAAGRVVPLAAERPPCDLVVEQFSDFHPSILPVIRTVGMGLNDSLPDAVRQRLLPYAPRVLCTNPPSGVRPRTVEEFQADYGEDMPTDLAPHERYHYDEDSLTNELCRYVALDWYLRIAAPAWIAFVSEAHAATLAALPALPPTADVDEAHAHTEAWLDPARAVGVQVQIMTRRRLGYAPILLPAPPIDNGAANRLVNALPIHDRPRSDWQARYPKASGTLTLAREAARATTLLPVASGLLLDCAAVAHLDQKWEAIATVIDTLQRSLPAVLDAMIAIGRAAVRQEAA